MNRRKFLHFLALLGLSPWLMSPVKRRSEAAFGDVTLMHFTDCHAQLLPVYYREPAVNIGAGKAKGRPPHLVGKQFLYFFGIKSNTN